MRRKDDMKILRMDRARHVTSGNMKTIAFFDLEFDDRIRFYGMRLIEAPTGKRFSYAPSSGGQRLATFAPDLAAEITALAISSYEGRTIANDSRTAA